MQVQGLGRAKESLLGSASDQGTWANKTTSIYRSLDASQLQATKKPQSPSPSPSLHRSSRQARRFTFTFLIRIPTPHIILRAQSHFHFQPSIIELRLHSTEGRVLVKLWQAHHMRAVRKVRLHLVKPDGPADSLSVGASLLQAVRSNDGLTVVKKAHHQPQRTWNQ